MNSTPTTVAPLVPLESVLCTEELNRRPSRPPNYETENRTLISLAQALADSPRTILQAMAEKMLEVFQCDSAGFSLLTHDEQRFVWAAVAGAWQPHQGGGTPRDFGPCGDVLDCNAPLLFRQWERRYPHLRAATPPAEEGLLVPFYVEGRAVGTIWAIAHDERRKFDSEDLRMLVSLGTFASAAYQAVEQVHALADAQARLQGDQVLREMNEALLVSSVRQHELTEQAEEATAALRVSEAFNRSILENSPDCVKVLDAAGRLMDMNANGLCLMEIDDFATVEGRRWCDLWPQEERVVVLAAIESARAGGTGKFQSRGLTAKGTAKWWDVIVAPIHDGEGEVIRFVSVSRDITDRKQSEEALRESEQRLRFVMDSIPQKIFTAQPDGDINYFNPLWTEFTGMSFEQMQDSGWTRFVHPDDVEEKAQHWRHAFDTGEPFESEHRLRRADGEYRWHFSRAVAMRDESGRITMWVGSNTDVHDMKQIGAALQEQARELTDQHRRKDEFLAMLSHELRNPLAPIINAVQMLRIQQSASGSSPQACEMIERQVGQLVHLVDDLLEVSRISTGRIHLQRKPANLRTIVECSVETVRPLIDQHRHVLAVSLPSASLWIDGDSTRLEQVVVNLLTNAAKYTADGGQIWLSLRQEGHEAVLQVRDSGVGIAPELLPRILTLRAKADTSPASRSPA